MIRSLALALAALLFAPAAAQAEDADDDVCVAWIHVFIHSKESPKHSLTIKSENTCLRRAESLDDEEPYADGKPYRGEGPEASVERECKLLGDRIAEIERSIMQAKERLPGAIEARDAAGDLDQLKYYNRKRLEWEEARRVLEEAKRLYEDVYGIDTVIQRDENDRITRVTRTGYDIDTLEGRAVFDAMTRADEAEEAMNAAWAATGGKAKAEQLRIDHFNSVLKTYPPELARAKARFKALGCQ
ncbi:MAG: hypothetical protein ACKV2T_31475 [Kofleriaceae bacterium]